MSNINVIKGALEARVASFAGVDLALPNVQYDSIVGTPFWRVLHEIVDVEQYTLCEPKNLVTTGLMVLGLNYPAKQGSGPVDSRIDDILNHFLPGTSIPAGSGYIVVTKASPTSKGDSTNPDWYVQPVVVYYTAYHQL